MNLSAMEGPTERERQSACLKSSTANTKWRQAFHMSNMCSHEDAVK